MEQPSPTQTPRKRGFFSEFFRSILEFTEPLWRAPWDRRYFVRAAFGSPVPLFSFLVLYAALGWYLKMPLLVESIRGEMAGIVADNKADLLSFYIQDGRLFTPENREIEVKNPAGKTLAKIIPQEEVAPEVLKSAPIVALKHRAVFNQKKGGAQTIVYAEKIPEGKIFRLTQEDLLRFVDAQTANQASQYYVNFVFFELVGRLTQALALGLVMWVCLRVKGVSLRGFNAVALAIAAMGPALLAQFFLERFGVVAFPVGLGAYWLSPAQAAFWTIAVFYGVVAVWSVRAAKIEKISALR